MYRLISKDEIYSPLSHFQASPRPFGTTSVSYSRWVKVTRLPPSCAL